MFAPFVCLLFVGCFCLGTYLGLEYYFNDSKVAWYASLSLFALFFVFLSWFIIGCNAELVVDNEELIPITDIDLGNGYQKQYAFLSDGTVVIDINKIFGCSVDSNLFQIKRIKYKKTYYGIYFSPDPQIDIKLVKKNP